MQNRSELLPGVYLTHLPAQKFKTGLMSAHLELSGSSPPCGGVAPKTPSFISLSS